MSSASAPSRKHDVIILLHFTGPPDVGGVENMLESERRVLENAGYRPVIVTGTKNEEPGHVHIPQLRPPSSSRGAPVAVPSVRAVEQLLEAHVRRAHQVWVHNALTVGLHPALAEAVHRLAGRHRNVRWVNVCADITAVSRFAPIEGAEDLLCRLAANARIEHAAISDRRRAELAGLIGREQGSIRLLRPAADPFRVTGRGTPVAALVEELRAWSRDMVVFVPAKVLPHKNLGFVVEVAREAWRQDVKALFLISGAPSPHEPSVSDQELARLHAAMSWRGADQDVVYVSERLGRPPSDHEMATLARVSDVALLPSHEEGFGMSVPELQLSRLPTVCADIPAFHESAGPFADFVDVSGAPAETLGVLRRLSASDANQARHAAAEGWQRFRREVLELAGGARPTGGS